MTERPRNLKEFRVCRFCLDDGGPFTIIYEKDTRDGKQQIPLPLQIMACVAIEVFPNDGMPHFICNPCRSQTIGAYNFKTTCKKADDTLKLYLATGNRKLVKPLQNKRLSKSATVAEHVEKYQSVPTPRPVIKPHQKPPPITTHNTITTAPKRAPAPPQQPPSKRPKPNPTLQSPNSETIRIRLEADPLGDGEEILPTAPTTPLITAIVDSGREHQVHGGGNSTEDGDSDEDEEGEEGQTGARRVYDEYYDEDDDAELRENQIHKAASTSTVYPCTQCDRSFPLHQQLDLHMKNHERVRNFSCAHADCGRMFFNKYDLAKHTQTHFDYKPYTCVVCEKTFARESLLHRHEKVHVNFPKYLCTHCDRSFLNREDYDAHSQKHKKRRPFLCRICNKSFVFKQGLERHEVAHADEKPHKCNYCEASFTSPIKLMRHITSHAGLRPYPCKLCGRTFLLSHHLTRHLKSHYSGTVGAGSEPPIGQHKCDVCSMSFRRKDSLINHSAIHSMVNLKCVICNTAFENAKQVKQHITSHLSSLPYPCDKCDYSFDTQDQLEEHELKHAEMEYEEQIEAEVTKEALEHEDDDDDDDDDDDGDDDDDEDDYEVDDKVVGGRGKGSGADTARMYKRDGAVGKENDREVAVEAEEEEEEEEVEGEEDDEVTGDMTEFTITESGLVPLQRTKKKRRSLTASINLSTRTTNAQTHKTSTVMHDECEHVDEHILPTLPPLPAAHAHDDVTTRHAHQHRPIDEQHDRMHIDDEFADDKAAVAEEIRIIQKREAAKEEVARLKPIVRSEGTKMYGRKAPAQKFKPQIVQPTAATMAPLSQINQSTLDTLGLTQQDVNSMPTKKYMDMKVGDKTVRVQKLIMTKSEIAAMAKEGKIEMKGGNIILKKTKGPLQLSNTSNSNNKPSRITLENILDDDQKSSGSNKQRIVSKKTYVKKSTIPTAISTPLANVNSELTITPVESTSNVTDVSLAGDIDSSSTGELNDAPPQHSIEEVNI